MNKIIDQHNFTSDTFLVTGAAGFIGSNLCVELVAKGANVIGIDNLSFGNIELVEEILSNPRFRFYQVDILSESDLMPIMKGVDFVLHQAALGSVPRSFESPNDYYLNNVMGTMNLVNVARLSGVKKVIYASSSSVYGDLELLPKIENKLGNVLSPYAHSKRLVEEFAESYSNLFNFPMVGLRYFNVYGPRQDYSRQYPAVISAFVSSAIKGEELIVHGDGQQSRDFTYVMDVVQANLLSCFINTRLHSIYNVGVGEEHNLIQIINYLEETIDEKLILKFGDSRQGDVKRSLADISQINNDLIYIPNTKLKQGISLTYDYYKNKLVK
jgi:UDP-N-acetylglucosamine/UDP-N-acetylgalactosamine 4-epimerase